MRNLLSQFCAFEKKTVEKHNKYFVIFNIQTSSYCKIDWWDAKDIKKIIKSMSKLLSKLTLEQNILLAEIGNFLLFF